MKSYIGRYHYMYLLLLFLVLIRGVDPYGTGGTRPPQYLDWGDSIMNVHPNILRVTSVTFHPYNMFLIDVLVLKSI